MTPGDHVRFKLTNIAYYERILECVGIVRAPFDGATPKAWWVEFPGVPNRADGGGLWDCYEHDLELLYDATDPT